MLPEDKPTKEDEPVKKEPVSQHEEPQSQDKPEKHGQEQSTKKQEQKEPIKSKLKDKPKKQEPEQSLKPQISEFQSALCHFQFETIEKDMSPFIKSPIHFKGYVGRYLSGNEILPLLKSVGNEYLLTHSKISGERKSEMWIINYPKNINIMTNLVKGMTKDEILQSLEAVSTPDQITSFQKIINVMLNSISKSWKACTGIQAVIQEEKTELIDLSRDIFDHSKRFIVIRAETEISGFTSSILVQIIPLRLAITLAAAISKNPIADLEQFVGAKIEVASLKGKVVLIVEDTFLIRQTLRRILENEGYKIVEAKNGKEALDLVRKEPLDLILLDIMMPDTDGFQFCKNLKETHKRDVPVIFCTALSEKELVQKAIGMGAVDYIVKPFKKEVVLSKVARVLEEASE